MQYMMGVDLGSTNIKSVIFDEGGNVVGRALAETPIERTVNGGEEWISYPPDKLWENVLKSIEGAVKMAPGDIACLAVTGLGMDSVPLDRHGAPLYPFISWRCLRGFPIFQSKAKKYGIEKLYGITGQLPRYLNSVIRYLWLKEHEPGLYARTEKWLTIEDYVNYKLCGVMATDYSMAATTLLCGIDRKWSDELLGYFGIDRRLVPEILTSGAVLGNVTKDVAKRTGLNPATLVVLGGHDYHCGSVSCGGFDEKKLVMSLGTYECNITSPKAAKPTAETLGMGMSYEGHVLPGRFSLATGMIEGGILGWWESQFEVANDWDAIMAPLIDKAAKMHMPLFMPHLYGSDAPENDPDSKGAFVGITASTTKTDMLYALIEGVNFQSVSLIHSMEKALGPEFETIHAIGAISKNKYMMQQKVDVLGRSIWVDTQNAESVCLGAAMLAGVGAGIYEDAADAYGHIDSKLLEYAPDMGRHEVYMERYGLFKQMYPALAALHAGLPYNI